MASIIRTNEEAHQAVATIVDLVKSGSVDPLIAIDVETSPLRSLVGYPQLGEDGELPGKKEYLQYVQQAWARNFNPQKLARLGIYVPKRLTNGNEQKGLTAKKAWELFLEAVERTPLEQLEQARWTPEEQPDAQFPIDARLLVHVVRVGVRNRVRVDPVRPGLDPYTSELFLLQCTLRQNGALLSWVFLVRAIDRAILLPLLRLDGYATYVGANIKFDLAHLLVHFGEAPKKVWCVRVASRMLWLGLKMSHSLAACAQRYAGVDLSKEERKLFIGRWVEEPSDEMLRYASNDTEILFPIYDEQRRLAEERGQLALIETFSRLSYPTAVWEVCGVQIDRQRWSDLAARVIAARDEVARELHQLLLPPGYTDFFPNTSDDDEEIFSITQRTIVIERLRALFGDRFMRSVFPDGKVRLDKEGREMMETAWMKEHATPHPFFTHYRRWSMLAKQASTYGYSFLDYVHPLTGRIHSSFTIAGTDTGRYSSTRPNLLNIPRGDEHIDVRSAFIAPEGYCFGNADYSAMEQRIAADITNDPMLVALFNAHGDGHSVTAAMMYHVRQSDVAEPRVSIEEWREGTVVDTIPVVELPAGWSPAQVVDFIIHHKGFTLPDGAPCSLMELISVKHKKTTRQSAKMVGLGKQFGMSKYGIARKKNIALKDAAAIEALYDGVYAVMKEKQDVIARHPFTNACIYNGMRVGYSLAYNGLRRWFAIPDEPNRFAYPTNWLGFTQFTDAQRQYQKECAAIEREAKNVGTQGGNAVIMAEAVLRLVELGEMYRSATTNSHTPEGRLRLGIFPWLAIYDEILALTPTNVDEREVQRIIEQAMLEPSEKYMKRVPSVVEVNPVSSYWKKY